MDTPTKEELKELINRCLKKNPDVAALAKRLGTSRPTILRWKEGQSWPVQQGIASAVPILKDYLKEQIHAEFHRELISFLTRTPDGTRVLSNTIKVPLPTIERWKLGKNFPHPSMAEQISQLLKPNDVPTTP